jgi:hypothetical protein
MIESLETTAFMTDIGKLHTTPHKKKFVLKADSIKRILADGIVANHNVSRNAMSPDNLGFVSFDDDNGIPHLFVISNKKVTTRDGMQKHFAFSSSDIRSIVAKTMKVDEDYVIFEMTRWNAGNSFEKVEAYKPLPANRKLIAHPPKLS